MGVNYYLVLVMPQMLNGVCRSHGHVEARHYEFLRETVREDLLEEWRVGGPQAAEFYFFCMVAGSPPRSAFEPFDVLGARNLAGLRILSVLFVTRSVGYVTPPAVPDMGGSHGARG